MENRLRPLGRAWGASGVAVALAVLTHGLAGGHAANPLLVAMAWALGAVVALPFTGRRPGTLRLAGLLLPAQVIYHLAFGGMHAGIHAGSHAGGQGHHLHGAELSTALKTPHAAAEDAAMATPGMLLAHLLAAIASVLIIRHAERGLETAAGLLHGLRARLDRYALRPRLPRLRAMRRRPWVPAFLPRPTPAQRGLPPAALTRRGPPGLLAAHA